jgi:hypothetical protein
MRRMRKAKLVPLSLTLGNGTAGQSEKPSELLMARMAAHASLNTACSSRMSYRITRRRAKRHHGRYLSPYLPVDFKLPSTSPMGESDILEAVVQADAQQMGV